jgi:ornithine cyclodeaminase/alanine dehydrogenase-like protein (mu-crystallin family)
MAILLCRQDVARLLDMAEVIEIMAKAFSDFAQGQAILPLRTPIPVPEHAGVSFTMPAMLKGMGALGLKVVTVYGENPAKYQLPTVLGSILVQDARTGAVVAVMEGGFLTAMRTGAVSGLATRLLARKDAKVHTVIGSGGMARAQIWGVGCARRIEKLILYSVDPMEARKAFKESLKDIVKGEIVLAEDSAKAVAEADILTLITNSKTPVMEGRWLKPGTHINGIGSHTPKMRELDTTAVQRAGRIVCDLVEACKAEAGDFIIPAEQGEWSWDKMHGSLGDVVTGKIKGRENDQEITLFKSVGLAIQDISTAQYIYEKALKQKVGVEFDFMK